MDMTHNELAMLATQLVRQALCGEPYPAMTIDNKLLRRDLESRIAKLQRALEFLRKIDGVTE